ncbi:MAG: HAD family hydrolase [Promethearchaeota archaeon]|nr:MAG: HAD family hydrolase [Candidatus Lokiarchaeota archaeon]
MKFDIYLFDLDGTLLHLGNIRHYAGKILMEALKRLRAKYPPTGDEKFKLWTSQQGYLKVLEGWGVEEPQNFWKFFDEIDFEKRKTLIKEKKVYLYQDVNYMLKKIYHHKDSKKLAIVTNTAYYICDFILNKFNIKKFFHETFSLGYYDNDQELAKPSPKGILTILDKFKYDPNESNAILVGDSKLDIIAAKNAKIYACLIRRELNPRNMRYKEWNIQPDFVIEELNELFDLQY